MLINEFYEFEKYVIKFFSKTNVDAHETFLVYKGVDLKIKP